jgi:hypothetical protein
MIVGYCLCHLDPSSVGTCGVPSCKTFLRLTLTSCGSKVFSRFVCAFVCTADLMDCVLSPFKLSLCIQV